MPFYNYTAVNTAGKRVRKRLEASSLETAKTSLRNTGYLVLEIKEQSEYRKELALPFLGNPRPKDMAIFCREFASVLRAGVPISASLGMLGQQTENKKLRDAVRGIQGDLEKGMTLTDAMRRYPRVFNGMLTGMVSAGERSGNLETVFDQMAVYFEKAVKTRNAVGKVMIYPAILIIIMMIVLFVMMTRIIPSFLKTFEDMGTELPKVTLAVMAVSRFFTRWRWLLILGIAALVIAGRVWGKTDRGRHVYGYLSRKLPVMKDLVTHGNTAAFCRTLSLLLASGMNMMTSIELTANNLKNIWFREAAIEIRRLISQGVSFGAAVRDVELFPPMVGNMAGIGEEAGDLQGMLSKTADYYEEEVQRATDRLLAMLEPAIIILMAGFVIIIVMSIFLPMLNMTQAYDQYLN